MKSAVFPQFPLRAVKRAISLNRVMIRTAKNVETERSKTRAYSKRAYFQKMGIGIDRMNKSLGHICHVVKNFLDFHWDGKSPLLIGYSGGPDSKALLYAVLAWGMAPIHIAHVDHGWREESREEALALEKEARDLHLPFHSIRLKKKTTEDEARQERLAFFRSLKETHFFQAVLLAHQADDLAETVLKRVFEGAYLPKIGGMRDTCQMDGLDIWRPLLNISRSKIEEYLTCCKLSFLVDPTNADPHYLRARMRSQLMPMLSETFGKNISKNLVVLSQRAHELEDYLALQMQRVQKNMASGPFGIWIDSAPLHPLELRELIQQSAELEEIAFSRPILESIVTGILQKKSNQKFEICHRTVVVDRGHLFLLKKVLPRFEAPISLTLGDHRSGDWRVQVLGAMEDESQETGWQALWVGKPLVQRFDGEAVLQLSSIRRNHAKVPAFLRALCPVLVKKSLRDKDFFTRAGNVGKWVVKISANC